MKKTSDNKRLIVIIAIVAVVAFVIGIVITTLVLSRGNKVSRYEWVDRICEIADIYEYETDEPFYDDVDRDNDHFKDIQAAVEADVIPITKKFNGEKPVTGEFAVVSALRAVDEYKRTRLHEVEDKNDDEYIAYALQNNLLDESELDKELSEERCAELFEAISSIIRGGDASEETSQDTDIPDSDIQQDSTNEAYDGENIKNTEEEAESEGNPDETESTAYDVTDTSGAVLDQHYTTKYSQINEISCPTFSFDYPSDWKITSEEYDSSGGIIEEVTLRDEDGATITYMHHGDGSFGPNLKNGTIKEVAKSRVIPSYPAGTNTDCSYLGDFVVALASEGEEYSLFGNYAVIPKSNVGDFEDIEYKLSFEYPQLWYMFVSYPPEHMNEEEGYSEVAGYSEQEIKEIVAILSSFRIEN